MTTKTNEMFLVYRDDLDVNHWKPLKSNGMKDIEAMRLDGIPGRPSHRTVCSGGTMIANMVPVDVKVTGRKMQRVPFEGTLGVKCQFAFVNWDFDLGFTSGEYAQGWIVEG